MADTLDIVTLAEAYQAVNNPAASGHDDELAQWITGVSRRIDSMCGPVVRRTTTDETHDGGTHAIYLDLMHATAVTSVTEYDDTTATTLTEETNASKPSDAYMLDSAGALSVLRRRDSGADSVFPAGRQNVLVTYTAGRYADTASVDPLFKAAVSAILRRLWQRDAGAWSRGADPFDQSTPAFFDAFKQSVKEYLTDELRPPTVA